MYEILQWGRERRGMKYGFSEDFDRIHGFSEEYITIHGFTDILIPNSRKLVGRRNLSPPHRQCVIHRQTATHINTEREAHIIRKEHTQTNTATHTITHTDKGVGLLEDLFNLYNFG